MNPIYTAEALATGGGRNGHVTTTDGRVDLELAIPKPMGGSGEGSNPEQLFAAGYAACFHSALQAAAREQKVTIEGSSVGAQVHIGTLDGGAFGLAVTLEVVLPDVPEDTARTLADRAHQICPYSNATRGNIEVQVNVVED
ncbi:putative organic hydroperoxide resistance protein/OsmC-like protein [Flavimobilis marinus]|uniref:Peroxiredoxin, Ohr subfamily n=1 Tax=Flavimobilis marinus TaxID=285351 RepID=A0A1I2D0G5_9MICO|nr:organic hydroperoxide resistance protein [Flavimobilis marinus]GHG46456.1 putative organic hydroperoxide resistance protein/OsmC-like protein [Flavimobilis marinus]SFE74028.1 peroxiredoxin, Ohr subfamily [Flavimobilis marinus]